MLAAAGRRPLNVRRAPGDHVRLVLTMAPGVAWPAALGALTVMLQG